jgi:MYXO-CTERM domain-containing protein
MNKYRYCSIGCSFVAIVLAALFLFPRSGAAQESCGTPDGTFLEFLISSLWSPGSGMIASRTGTIDDTDNDFNEVDSVSCWLSWLLPNDEPEHVYRFAPQQDVALNITALGDALDDIVRIAVVSPCPSGDTFCATSILTTGCTVFEGGVTYSIILSGTSINPSISYTLTLEECQSCGDGSVQPGEQCDSGGANTADCDSDCTLPECGDGILNTAAGEACDSEGEDTEDCNSDCTLPSCGDSHVNTEAGEACDDGGDSATCNSDCTLTECGDLYTNQAAGEACDEGADTETCDSDCTEPVCGDAHLNIAFGEACDTGGESATCNSDCTLPVCGDKIVNEAAGEACDDGRETANCDSDCTAPVCGDHHINSVAGETCDDGNATATCNADCTAADCGDGIFNPQADEECDDGNSNNADGCLNGCKLATCGDGYIYNQHEACDDGNTKNGDGCDNDCDVESGYQCKGVPSECDVTCGNGQLENAETCDDSNRDSGDGCNDDCETETGYRCHGEPSKCRAICGDGIRLTEEACDDGNTKNGDGCDENCEIEENTVDKTDDAGVENRPDESSNGKCSNGKLDDSDEECDDSNSNNGDGCSSACRVEAGWVCEGEPSVCVRYTAGEDVDAGAPDSGYEDAGTPKDSSSGCGCSIPKQSSDSKEWIFVLLGIGLIGAARRRKR